jgi:hypothetical protein
MQIVGALDVHRRQITYKTLDLVNGEVRRGRLSPANRESVASAGSVRKSGSSAPGRPRCQQRRPAPAWPTGRATQPRDRGSTADCRHPHRRRARTASRMRRRTRLRRAASRLQQHPKRMASEASFAALAGTNPLDASSGQQRRHRLTAAQVIHSKP